MAVLLRCPDEAEEQSLDLPRSRCSNPDPPTEVKQKKNVQLFLNNSWRDRHDCAATKQDCDSRLVHQSGPDQPHNQVEGETAIVWIKRNFLHHDKASAHTAKLTESFLVQHGIKILHLSPYSPDLSPCDFFLFQVVKNKLRGRRFSTGEELLSAAKKHFKRCLKKSFVNFLRGGCMKFIDALRLMGITSSSHNKELYFNFFQKKTNLWSNPRA
jgi:hypothetical protein